MSVNGIKLVVGVLILGGASAFVAKDRANTFKEYGLSGPTLTLAKSCDSSMRKYRVEFTEGASNYAGCACLAREVSANIDTPNYDYLSENYANILKARNNKNEDAAASALVEVVMSGDDDDAADLMTMMGLMATCSNRTSEQEIRQSYIAKNTQNGVPAGPQKTVADSNSARSGLRSSAQKKPSNKCASLTEKQLAQREENASEAGLRFDRDSCKSYSP